MIFPPINISSSIILSFTVSIQKKTPRVQTVYSKFNLLVSSQKTYDFRQIIQLINSITVLLNFSCDMQLYNVIIIVSFENELSVKIRFEK